MISFLERRKPVALRLEPPIKMGELVGGKSKRGCCAYPPKTNPLRDHQKFIVDIDLSAVLAPAKGPNRCLVEFGTPRGERGGGFALINFPFAMPTKRKRHWRDYFNLHRSVRNYFIEAGWPPTRAKIHRRRFSTKLQFTNLPLPFWCVQSNSS